MKQQLKTILTEVVCLAFIIGLCILIGYVFIEHSLPVMGFK